MDMNGSRAGSLPQLLHQQQQLALALALSYP